MKEDGYSHSYHSQSYGNSKEHLPRPPHLVLLAGGEGGRGGGVDEEGEVGVQGEVVPEEWRADGDACTLRLLELHLTFESVNEGILQQQSVIMT